MKALMIFTIIWMLLLISCSESTKPDYEPFSLKVTLRDAAGNSLEGYRIAIFQEDLGIPGYEAKPSTSFHFTIDSSGLVNLTIYDFFNRKIKQLINSSYPAGTYLPIVWDGYNDEGQIAIDGVYRAVLKCYADSTLVKEEVCYPYLITWLDASVSPYFTDANGIFSSEDINPYPALYCNVAVQEYDEEGNSHGPIELNTTMKIVFQAPDQTCRSAVFQIKNGNNVLSYVWEDLSPDKTLPLSPHTSEIQRIYPIEPDSGKGKQPLFNYPNPFN